MMTTTAPMKSTMATTKEYENEDDDNDDDEDDDDSLTCYVCARTRRAGIIPGPACRSPSSGFRNGAKAPRAEHMYVYMVGE